jgi:uncharacterized protein HemX
MKATALVAAVALACGTAAFAQQTQDRTARQENAAADSIKPADDAQRTKNAVRKLGDKTRHAMHRAEDKVRHMSKNDKDRHHHHHARAEHDRYGRDHDRHARSDRHDDTRAMGAGAGDMRDAEMARRQRMDDAYDNWKSKQRG